MIPNNNISVLPWYTSIEQQNARKWWVYNRIYPLFTPATSLLPFQIMRDHVSGDTVDIVGNIVACDKLQPGGIPSIWNEGGVMNTGYVDVSQYRNSAIQIAIRDNIRYAFIKDIPTEYQLVQFAEGSNVIEATQDVDTTVPSDANYLWLEISYMSGGTLIDITPYSIEVTPAQLVFEIYKANGEYVGDYTNNILPYISIKQIGDIDVIVYTGQFPIFTAFENGQYYGKITDGPRIWYSEIFTAVNDIQPYLKIEWWDNEDFIMDAGAIVYKNPNYHNVLYLDSDLAKPEYVFEEEGESRDGYFFPVKQISEKRFRFKFFASEYLLDVMRFIRMSDYAKITYHGQTYNLDTFLITEEWEDNGDVASVEATFDTATVAKKIGQGYLLAQRGDFNNDYNDDYLINP